VVKDYVKRLLDTLGATGGYFLGPCHNIQVGTPPENVLAMYNALYEYFGVDNPTLSELATAREHL